MGLFVCAKCKCVENTALGHWWSRHRIEMFKWDERNEQFKGEGLCSECMPLEFSDNSGKCGNGKWHNKFPKRTIDEFMKSDSSKYYQLTKDGNLVHIGKF